MGLRELMSLEACAEMFNGVVSADRLRELADSGHLPHVVVDGNPCVDWGRVETWINKNLVTRRCSGQNLPGIVTIPKGPQNVPETLRPMRLQLRAIKMPEYPPGIYFLCREDRLVYVGQSVAPLMRVFQHVRAGKEFEHAFYVPVPEERLNEVEGAFIRFFKPELNGPGPAATIDRDGSVLAEFGLAEPVSGPLALVQS